MSKNTQHTKGPWSVGNPTLHEIFIMKSGSVQIATVNTCADEKQEDSILMLNPDEALANAALIAACPELLRELKSAICYIETYGGDVTASFAAGGNLDAVKAVIAKAEGKN
jgi:hypothetical protein